jgi:hypothetical protein
VERGVETLSVTLKGSFDQNAEDCFVAVKGATFAFLATSSGRTVWIRRPSSLEGTIPRAMCWARRRLP